MEWNQWIFIEHVCVISQSGFNLNIANHYLWIYLFSNQTLLCRNLIGYIDSYRNIHNIMVMGSDNNNNNDNIY